MLTVDGVAKRFGRQEVLQDVSFELGPQEVLVVLGPSGSGKTTLLRIIAGLETADAGEVTLDGRSVTRLAPQARRLGVVFQEQALFDLASDLVDRADRPVLVVKGAFS